MDSNWYGMEFGFETYHSQAATNQHCSMQMLNTSLSGIAWYDMKAGIHQGGYLSLLKYIAFIDSLIADLENSGLCCSIEAVSVSPRGEYCLLPQSKVEIRFQS